MLTKIITSQLAVTVQVAQFLALYNVVTHYIIYKYTMGT